MIFQISTLIDEDDIVGGKPQEWWLYGPAWMRPFVFFNALPIVVTTFVFAWATEVRPNLAVILGALLTDFVIVARGRRILRGFVTFFLVCAVVAALQTGHWHPSFLNTQIAKETK